MNLWLLGVWLRAIERAVNATIKLVRGDYDTIT